MEVNDLQQDQKKLDIIENQERFQFINEQGNIEEIKINKYFVSHMDFISVKKNYVTEQSYFDSINGIISKGYVYLKYIDDDTYVFGELNKGMPITEKNISSNIKYGIFKLQRDKNKQIIPNNEKIIVDAIYDEINQNNCKTVTALTSKGYTYFDYEKEKQLIPAVLEYAGKFGDFYEDFAICIINKQKYGFLYRDSKPVKNYDDIAIFSEKEVKLLTGEYYDDMMDADEKFKQISGISYSLYKKNKNI